MKIYETRTAPNPRRVRIFLAEKNIPMEYVQLDLLKGENMAPEMRAKNPIGKVPILELDDGTCIGETVAICRYFEETHPASPLFGATPLAKAQIEMWQRQVEFGLMMQIGMCFQHTTGYFKDRMTPVKEFGEVAGNIAQSYLKQLERRLTSSEFIGGDSYSIADITALCAIDFARVVKVRPDQTQTNIQRWYDAVSSRPSAQA